jgi:hypothetical protein
MSLHRVYPCIRRVIDSTFSHERLPRRRFWPLHEDLVELCPPNDRSACIYAHMTEQAPSREHLPALLAPYLLSLPLRVKDAPPQHNRNWMSDPLDVISVTSSSG